MEVEFLKKKIETEANTSFFNVVKIKNPSERSVTFLTNFSHPSDWSFMGEKKQRITLAPSDSILIPFRAATSINAKGDIGYAIVASLSDLKGNPFKSEYSFVNVPKIQDIVFTPMNKIEYIDQIKSSGKIALFMANNGNTEEEFYLDFKLSPTVEIPGTKENYYHLEYLLRPYSDTIVELPLMLKPDIAEDEQFHRVIINASTADTLIKTSVWLKKLNENYYNQVPSTYKMIELELGIQNLFSKFDPIYVFNLRGNLLFKKQGQIYYKVQGLNTQFYENPWVYGRYMLRYRYKGFYLEGGDISGPFYQNVFGRGVKLEYNFNKNLFNALATKSLLIEKQSYGALYKRTFKTSNIGGGYSVVDNKTRGIKSDVAFLQTGLDLRKIGTLNFMFSTSTAQWYIPNINHKRGFSGELSYSGDYNKLIMLLSARYGDRNFMGNYAGRLNSILTARYILSKGSNLNFNYYLNQSSPVIYNQGNIEPAKTNTTHIARLYYNKHLNKSTYITLGPMSEHRYSNNFYGQTFPHDFSVTNGFGYFNLRYRDDNMKNTQYGLYAQGGYNVVTNYNKTIHTSPSFNKGWPSFEVGLSYRGRIWGAYLNYYHGPTTVNQHFNYASLNYYPRNVRVMPYIEFPLINQLLYFNSRLNYIYDISAQSNRLNLTSDLTAHIDNTWRVVFSNTIGNTSTIDNITEEKFSYTSTYFELRIKKDFLIKQPRYQYYDVDLYFFKDLNGNRVKDEDEPGIQNVFVSFNKDDERVFEEEYNTTGQFMPTELLSDIYGHVKYENIPNGFYIIGYNPIGEIKGAYSSEESFQTLYIGKNEKLYIPFVENNKIFGRVLLNRSKLSNLGQIEVSNIKVTAEDSHGRKYSTLTDGNGNFTIYVPNVDRYKVRVNNIFFENFDLEQNNYEVQLNGYKQFEVNFIFNEKKRRINFTSSYEYGNTLDKDGVEIVRRTNLNGTVKNATTLKPVVATVRVIDSKGNEITSTKSNLKTGIFITSFIAGNDYAIEVTADEYWFNKENLYSQQLVTFKNLKKDILLKPITVGQLIPMKTLFFDAGSTEIPPTSFPELERLLKVLKSNPSVKIAVHGHADDLEILDSETDLALERAKIISKYLIAMGYNRVKYVGHANTMPAADNDTETGRRQNRRVVITVTAK